MIFIFYSLFSMEYMTEKKEGGKLILGFLDFSQI